MPDNKTFHFTLFISLLVHSFILIGLPHIPFYANRKIQKDLKVVYCKVKKIPEVKKLTQKKINPIVQKLPEIKKEEILKPLRRISSKRRRPKSKPRPMAIVEPQKEKRFETIVKEEQDDVKKSTYISYYRAVREKIRQCADRNYPQRKRIRRGEVFLSFVVASSGELLQVKVINDRSIDEPLLRNVSINSIRDASPFPPFPHGMSQYQITFNVIISFELNK